MTIRTESTKIVSKIPTGNIILMYILNPGKCTVVKAKIEIRIRRYLADTEAVIPIIKLRIFHTRHRIDHEHAVMMKAANQSTFKIEGSINFPFKLGNRHRVYIFDN